MMKLMDATISRGTSRRAFKGYRRDRVLSGLSLGGKTGSIKNETDEWLFDWFVVITMTLCHLLSDVVQYALDE